MPIDYELYHDLEKMGLTGDYIGALNTLGTYILNFTESTHTSHETILKSFFKNLKPVETYTERYLASNPQIFTDKTKRRIARVDQLAEEINYHIKKGNKSTDVYKALGARISFYVLEDFRRPFLEDAIAYDFKKRNVPKNK